jgi:hypothetical protein
VLNPSRCAITEAGNREAHSQAAALRGSGLNRKDVWDEIKRPLGSLNELAIYFNIPLLVGGDFYIDPEALVTEVEVAKGKKSKTETQQAKEYKL